MRKSHGNDGSGDNLRFKDAKKNAAGGKSLRPLRPRFSKADLDPQALLFHGLSGFSRKGCDCLESESRSRIRFASDPVGLPVRSACSCNSTARLKSPASAHAAASVSTNCQLLQPVSSHAFVAAATAS